VKASNHVRSQNVDVAEEETEEKPHANITDRFYRTLYESLLRTHKTAFLDEYFGLLFRAIKIDTELGRTKAFLKRMIQMAYNNEPNYAAATLLVVSEVI